MSYVIFYEQFVPLLNSKDDDIIKNTFQKIFELLVDGKSMPRSKRKIFIQDVNIHIVSKSAKVRKWAYHCACFYKDESTYKLINENLKTEQNKENIIWALTALSTKYDNEFKLKQCVGQRHEEFINIISEKYLTDALVLFGGMVKINPKTILLTNNSTDLVALTKIYAYRNLVENKYGNILAPDIIEPTIREMEKHNESYVREYAYWSQLLRDTKGDFLNVPDDSNDEVRKWQIANQIKIGDEDFVVSALKPLASCPEKISDNIKNGILRGLNKISYNSKYIPYINCWFEREEKEPIVFLLIDYMLANCYFNQDDGTYFYAIKDSLNDQLLLPYITNKIKNNPQYKLTLVQSGDNYVLDYKIKEGITMKNIKISGSGNTIVSADEHSSITFTSSHRDINELLKLINDVKNQAESLSKNDKQKVNEGLSFIEAEVNNDNPRKTIIKGILDGLKAIKANAPFLSAVTTLFKFIEEKFF